MNYLSTTQLRTQTPLLIRMLIAGKKVKLLHRSKVVGQIVPLESKQTKIFRAQDLLKSTHYLNLKKYSPDQIRAKYKTIVNAKHG